MTGCVSSGTQVSEAQAKKFKKGVTTEAQVIAALGQPQTTTLTADGRRIDIYTFSRDTPTAMDFVPYVGLLDAGAHQKTTNVAFTFSKTGILQGYTSTAGHITAHYGIFN